MAPSPSLRSPRSALVGAVTGVCQGLGCPVVGLLPTGRGVPTRARSEIQVEDDEQRDQANPRGRNAHGSAAELFQDQARRLQ